MFNGPQQKLKNAKTEARYNEPNICQPIVNASSLALLKRATKQTDGEGGYV